MVARAVDDARTRLHDLRTDEWQEGAVGAAALALAVVVATRHSDFAVPLFVGGIVVGARGLLAAWRRWDLVDRLIGEPDAYAIPDVLARARREAGMSNRRMLSASIRRRVAITDTRAALFSEDMVALADALADPELELDPAWAVACSRFLSDHENSPLLNAALPAVDVPRRIVQIRAGFHPRA
jgi:hypothetical protein